MNATDCPPGSAGCGASFALCGFTPTVTLKDRSHARWFHAFLKERTFDQARLDGCMVSLEGCSMSDFRELFFAWAARSDKTRLDRQEQLAVVRASLAELGRIAREEVR